MLLHDDLRRRLCLARDALESLEGDAPTVAVIARQAGVSPFHFIRLFEQTFGQTPHQHRIGARVERARVLLSRGQHSVTEVCLEVGFSSVSSFSGLFARRVGEPPSAYARRVRPLAQVPSSLGRSLTPGCLSLMGLLPPDAFRNFREA